MNKNDLVKRWFHKVSNDLKNIENNLKTNDSPLDTVCFHAQQAIEKYMKGALIYFGKEISRTHDLIKLLNDLKDYIPDLAAFANDLENINVFGVEIRYPDFFYDPTLEETKKSYETAKRIKDIILNKVKF
ncbi:MAG: HEPN domain-containing protein [Spirochaetes bacterium]|nr:HEPN domain-containing protein [Spirochaetota bacterium]